MDILKNLKRSQKGELKVSRPTVGGGKHAEIFLGGVVHEALQHTMRCLPQPIRDQYSGDVSHTEDLTADAWVLSITLTHLQTRNVIKQQTLIKNKRIRSSTNPVRLATELGSDIGRRLVTDIKAVAYKDKRSPPPPEAEQHNKSITGKWEQAYPKHMVKAATLPKTIDPDTLEPEPEPPKLCKVCGVTDSKYPDWIECSHNLDTSA